MKRVSCISRRWLFGLFPPSEVPMRTRSFSRLFPALLAAALGTGGQESQEPLAVVKEVPRDGRRAGVERCVGHDRSVRPYGGRNRCAPLSRKAQAQFKLGREHSNPKARPAKSPNSLSRRGTKDLLASPVSSVREIRRAAGNNLPVGRFFKPSRPDYKSGPRVLFFLPLALRQFANVDVAEHGPRGLAAAQADCPETLIMLHLPA